MPRVVPSQVREFIDNLPSYQAGQDATFVNFMNLGVPNLSAIVDLVEQIPDELLTMDPTAYASLVRAKAQIRVAISERIADRQANVTPRSNPLHVAADPVRMIREALAKCPDESPAPGTSELKFVKDPDLKENLRNDFGAIERALSHGEWKAATVLAGSTIEALLLWDLQNRVQAQIPGAVAALTANKTFTSQLSTNLEDRSWSLHHYIEVAAQLGRIEPNTLTEARLAKDFRNLIHPARSQRLGQKCDRGTALECVAALEHVVVDLSRWP
jgi:hypothetical protein